MHLNINMDWLSAKSLPIIGLDISTTAVKLVELSDAGKGMLRVERYAIEPLPKDAVTDGNIANLDQVAEAVRTAWKEMGTRIRNVALALPSSAVITKKILAPASLTGIDLENQVESEANQVIPFSLDEVNLDFQDRFDLVYERAFLCALPRRMWAQYAARVAALLHPAGLLAGFFFFDDGERGPPFGLKAGELEALLAPRFDRLEDRAVDDSLPIFAGRERWQVWRLRSGT